jgi:ribosomal protein L35AE/L33A
MKKGDEVFYTTQTGAVIRARVERVHRDGSITVRALFEQRDGKDVVPGHLGYRYRMSSDGVRASA